MQVDGLGAGPGAGVDVQPDQLWVLTPGHLPVDDGEVLRLDRAERLSSAVDALVAQRPDLVDASPAPWLHTVEALMAGALGRVGDYDRARLLAARAVVLLAGEAGGIRQAHQEAVEAARLFERSRDVLAAATSHAVAALAAVRAGDVGQALNHAVQALVAFGSLSDGERDPDGEAEVAEMLGRLCQQVFDHQRALQFFELAARALRDVPHDRGRAGAVQARIGGLLLQQAADAHDGGANPDEADLLVARAELIAHRLLAQAPQGRSGRRLLAGVLCQRGRGADGWELLAAQDSPDGEFRLTRARCLQEMGRNAEALADLEVAEAAFAERGDLAQQIAALRLRSAVREARGDLTGALRDARLLADLVWQRHRRQVGGFMDQVWSRAGVEGQRRDLEARARVLLRVAEQDSLTSLANRWAMERFCAGLAPQEQICLVLVDVDHFKNVNDRHGHMVGDVVLREVATVLAGAVRAKDRVARWGGEEFLIALPGGSAALGAEAAGRLRRRIEDHAWSLHAPGLRLTVSAGVSAGPAVEFATVLARADAAVYAAKRAGRNRVVTS